MKQAMIITAYQNFDFLKEIIDVYSIAFKCYVHIDKKCNLSSEMLEKLSSGGAYVISRYKINWGSYKHILAINDLLKKALDDGCEYFHVISANTIPTKHPSIIKDHFEGNNKDIIFMECKSKTDKETDIFKEFEYRYSAYFFHDIIDIKKQSTRTFWLKAEKASTIIQRKLHIRKGVEFQYKGYVYCHLSLAAVMYLFDFLEANPNYLNKIKRCYVGEEFYFQNIFMESQFANQIVNDSLIYSIWGDRGHPAYLEKRDIDLIEKSGKFFARKVKPYSELFGVIRDKSCF